MEDRVVDVCVVGAGFAGLAAARRLVAAGRTCAVLEARDRVGGRVWNREMDDGTVVSVGGTWLGRDQHRMFALSRELGMATYEQFEAGDTVLRYDGENHRYRGLIPKVDLLSLAGVGLAVKRLDRLTKRLPIDAPWEARGAARLDAVTLGAWLGRRTTSPTKRSRQLLTSAMGLLFTCDPAEVSLLGALVLARGGGNFEYYTDSTITETHLLDGGTPELAARLAAALGDALCLSAPVRRIVQDGAGVVVHADSVTVRAGHAVVATPPVLASQLEFDPPLPAAYGHLHRRLVPGAITRIITSYDEPFWRTDGLNGQSLGLDSPLSVSIDQTPRSGAPGVLSSYLAGPASVELGRLDPTARRDLCLGALADRFGPRAARPVSYLETDWSAEQWSQGGMIGHFAPGVLTSYGWALRQPAGRIYWAGTERATEMHGLIEGAVRSGERAADEILAVTA